MACQNIVNCWCVPDIVEFRPAVIVLANADPQSDEMGNLTSKIIEQNSKYPLSAQV